MSIQIPAEVAHQALASAVDMYASALAVARARLSLAEATVDSLRKALSTVTEERDQARGSLKAATTSLLESNEKVKGLDVKLEVLAAEKAQTEAKPIKSWSPRD